MIHLSLNNTCYSNYEDRLERLELIDRKVSALIDLFRQLQSEAPGLRLYVIGYPEVADPDGNCANNVHLNRSELEFSEQIIRYLDASIHYAAGQAGADYIDISKALYGHRLCETSSDQIAVNGLTAGNDAGPIGHESYHPNALGHALIAQSIREQTADFSLWSAAVSPSPPDNAGILQSVTKTGRQMYAVDAAQNMATLRGARLDIRLVGAETGLRPNASYSIALDGPDGRLLASALTDEWGDMNVSLGLPADVTGDHFIDVSGPGQGDQLLDISQSIYVSDPPANSNGISVKIGNLYVSG